MITDDWKSIPTANGLEIAEPVEARVTIQAGAEAVWAVISAPGGLETYHPFCAENTVGKWPGADAEDRITYFSGLSFRRRFRRWFEGVGYDLELGAGPQSTAWVQWRIEPGQGSSSLTIRVYPLLNAALPEEMKKSFLERQFGDLLSHYLDCVVKGVRHRVETGTPVSEDQFGRNAIYSAAAP